MGAARTRFLAAHRPGVVVSYGGYTSVMSRREEAYAGDLRMKLHVHSAHDIGAFSLAREPELILPRGAQLQVRDLAVGRGDHPDRIIVMSEADTQTTVPVWRQFAAAPAAEGEAAAELLQYSARGELTPEQQRRADDHLERTAVELGGPIPARFAHLQYLNQTGAELAWIRVNAGGAEWAGR